MALIARAFPVNCDRGEVEEFIRERERLQAAVDQAYEAPESPEIRLLAGRDRPDVLAQYVVDDLATRRLF